MSDVQSFRVRPTFVPDGRTSYWDKVAPGHLILRMQAHGIQKAFVAKWPNSHNVTLVFLDLGGNGPQLQIGRPSTIEPVVDLGNDFILDVDPVASALTIHDPRTGKPGSLCLMPSGWHLMASSKDRTGFWANYAINLKTGKIADDPDFSEALYFGKAQLLLPSLQGYPPKEFAIISAPKEA